MFKRQIFDYKKRLEDEIGIKMPTITVACQEKDAEEQSARRTVAFHEFQFAASRNNKSQTF